MRASKVSENKQMWILNRLISFQLLHQTKLSTTYGLCKINDMTNNNILFEKISTLETGNCLNLLLNNECFEKIIREIQKPIRNELHQVNFSNVKFTINISIFSIDF